MGDKNNEVDNAFHIDCPIPGCLYSAVDRDPKAAATSFKAHVKKVHPNHYSEFLKGEADAERE